MRHAGVTVDVTFKTTVLKRAYETLKAGTKRWGEVVARRYILRVNVLYAVRAGDDLYAFPELRFHPLKGDRKGEYAISLDGAWRLVVTFSDEEMTVVRVEEVSKHYGD